MDRIPNIPHWLPSLIVAAFVIGGLAMVLANGAG